MGERKVLNKYFSPDFDPKLIPRMRREKGNIQEVRMMLPFSMQCKTCGEFMYRGKKFNSKKMDVDSAEDYMGVRKFRFFIKCCVCSQEIIFKTDPKNADYELERGATRNFEAWKEKDAAEEKLAKEQKEEERADAMKALENRTLNSKMEMDILDALDEVRALNKKHDHVDLDAIVEDKAKKERERAEAKAGLISHEEEDRLVKSIVFKSGSQNRHGGMKRLVDDERTSAERENGMKNKVILSIADHKPAKASPAQLPVVKKKRKLPKPKEEYNNNNHDKAVTFASIENVVDIKSSDTTKTTSKSNGNNVLSDGDDLVGGLGGLVSYTSSEDDGEG